MCATKAGQRAVPQGDRLQLGEERLANGAQICEILLRQNLAVAGAWVIRRVQLAARRGHGGLAVHHTNPLVHEQCLIGPPWKRRRIGRARMVVEIQVDQVEVSFEFQNHFQKPDFVDTVEFDRQLVDPLEHGVRRGHERFPFGAFHVHRHDEPLAGIAVRRDLVRQRVEEATLDGFAAWARRTRCG